MALIPAVCDSCGATWGDRGFISGTGGSNITITGSKVGPCPNCGGMGSIPDGMYDLQDDTLKVIQASGTSPESLQGLISLLESLQRGDASTGQVMAAVEREAPELAATVQATLAKPDPAKWIAILIAMIALYLQASTPAPPSADEVAHALEAEPLPTYSVPAPTTKPPPPKARAKPKRPSKTYGKAKERRSRKRR